MARYNEFDPKAAAWAAGWAAEVAAGRVRPDGVIATGVVPDVGGDR